MLLVETCSDTLADVKCGILVETCSDTLADVKYATS